MSSFRGRQCCYVPEFNTLQALIESRFRVGGIGLAGSATLSCLLIAVLFRLFESRLIVMAVLTGGLMLFSGSLAAVTGISFVSYLDELAVLILLSIVMLSKLGMRNATPTAIPGAVSLVLFVLVGIVSAIVKEVDASTWILGAYVAIKGPIFAACCASLVWSRGALESLSRLFTWLVSVCLCLVLVNWLLGARWTAFFGDASLAGYRFGTLSLQGPFTNYLISGLFFACCAVVVFSRSLRGGWGWLAVIQFIGCVAAVAASGRRSALVGLLLALLIVGALSGGLSVVLGVIGCAVLFVIPAARELRELVDLFYAEYVVDSSASPRMILLDGAIRIASEYFPLGAGFGRYGSLIAATQYSGEYLGLGYDRIWGLSPYTNNDSFLTDTQWPMVLGEAGILGLMFCMIGLARLFRAASSADSQAESRGSLESACLGLSIVALAGSLAQPTFIGGYPTQALLYGVAGISLACKSWRLHFDGSHEGR